MTMRILVSTGFMLVAAVAAAADFHVSPTGCDAADGSIDRPFATLARARDAVRAARKSDVLPKDGMNVWLHGGEYTMRETLALDAKDSGAADAPVSYRAWKGERPVLVGTWTVPQSAWRKADDPRIPAEAKGKVWMADVKVLGYDALEPDAPCGFHTTRPEFRIRSLYCDGKRLTPTRHPNTGFLRTGTVVNKESTFKADLGDMARWSRTNAPCLEALGYWKWLWADQTLPVSVDPSSGTISFVPAADKSGSNVETSFHLSQSSTAAAKQGRLYDFVVRGGMPFYLQNALAALDAPGEWHLDCTTGLLYVYPEGGKDDDPTKSRYELSLAAKSLVSAKDAAHIRFEGIAFRGGRHHGVEMHGVSDVTIERCAFRDFGGHGLVFDRVRDSLVRGCSFRTFGHSAMTLDGGDRKTLTASGVTIDSCDFSDTGLAMRTYTPGIWVTGCGHRIVRSHFHDLPSSALRIGGNEHLVASNLVERVVMESDDQGAVDMWGDPTYRGNRFIHNIFRDVGRGGAFVRCGQGGIRFDDAISGNLVYGNRFDNCSKVNFGGVQIHGGRDNVVRNNVFTRCRYGITVSPWPQEHWRKFLSGERGRVSREAANVDGAAFRTKYPEFASALDTPMRNTFECNVFVGDEKSFTFVSRNRQIPEATVMRGNVCVPKLPADLSSIPGFEPLPPENAIGPGADVFLEKAHEPAPIVFETPAEHDRGAMILGNGELGALAWVSSDGTLHTVLQRSDTWNEAARHVKAGAIDYVTSMKVDAGTFRQELSLATGEFNASWHSEGREVSVHYRVQHGGTPFAVCDVKGAPKTEAKVVNWRLYPGGAKEFGCGWKELGNQCDRILVDGKPPRFIVSADRLVPGGWCHVNRNDTVAEMMKIYDRFQATDDLGREDMLSNRVFGGVTRKITGTTVASPVGDVKGQDARSPSLLFLSAITCLHPCKDEAEWLRRTNELLDRDGWTLDAETARRAAHRKGWDEFWRRSHITVTPSAGQSPRDRRAAFAFPYNAKLPVSIGRDSKGGTKFDGILNVNPKSRIDKDGLFLAATFNAPDTRRNQRIIDNITPGGMDGSLVDILGGRLRLLVAKKAVLHPSKVPVGRDVSVEVSVSPDGKVEMVLDGKVHTSDLAGASIVSPATCAAVTRAWAAQRYTTACAGKGTLPIRFNGSIFTTSENGDPDYRRWGHGYWWQNTRLPYFPMFAAGDCEMLKPLFRMYVGLLDFNAKRTRKYLGHGGAYIPECIMPWGDHFPSIYGAKYAWKDRPDKLQDGGWHKYEWVGQLEVSLMLLDYHAYIQDDAWFKQKALPAIREYVRFFDEHYKLDAKGRYNMNPAQAVETWWDCTNPMPEVAGLTCVTERLLALPKGLLPDADRALFAKIRARIPDLPTRTLKDGTKAYAPAERFANKRNVEHPELYCVFPFRLCSFEKPNAVLGRAAYAARTDRHYQGWKQEELFAAYLGMTDEAAKHLANRALHNSAEGFRWPAYWGPNFDWRPDQCAGGNIQNILQSMLMQCEGRKIFLLPAWPKGWDCTFKLHAPYKTMVEGRVQNGEVRDLVVTPASRRTDVVLPEQK